MAANRIVLQVDFQANNAQQQIDQLNQKITGIGTTSQQASTQAATGLKGITLSVDQVSRSVLNLGAALAGISLGALSREWLSFARTVQVAGVAMSNAFGPAVAKDLIEQMRALANVTGLSSEALVRNAQDLALMYRLPAQQIPGFLKIVTDFVAFMGKGQDSVDAFTKAFGTAFERGYLMAKDANQKLVALGLPAVDILSKALGKNRFEIKNILAKTETDVHVFADQLLMGMQKLSVGMAAKLKAGVTALQFQDVLNQLRDVGEKAFIILEPAILKTIDALRKFVTLLYVAVDALGKLDDTTKKWIVTLLEVAAALIAINAAVKIAVWGWGLLAGGFAAILTVIRGLIAAVGILIGLFTTLRTIIAAIAVIMAAPEATIAAIIALLVGMVVWLESDRLIGAFKALGGAWDFIAGKAIAAFDTIKAGYVKVRDFIFGKQPPEIGGDPEKAKRQIEAAQNVLDEARARELKAGKESIEALGPVYDKHFRDAAGNEKALALLRIALAKDVNAEITKIEEEGQKAHLKMVEETARLTRQVRIAQAELVPDETFAGRERVAAIRAQAFEEQFRTVQAAESARIQDQLAKQVPAAAKEMKRAGETRDAISKEVARLNQVAKQAEIDLNAKTDKEIQEHRLKTEGDTNKLIYEQQKLLRQQTLEDQLDFIQKGNALRLQQAQAALPQTFRERVEQIVTVRNLEIQTIAETRAARLRGAQEEFDAYKTAHADFAQGIEYMEAQLARERVSINREADAAIQASRLNAWREANATIIEEQRRIYDIIKSGAEKVWDAFTDKTKSIWASIGNLIKNTIVNAFREAFSSRLAASLTQAISGSPVTFPGGPLSNIPKFGGLGAPPALSPLAGPASYFKISSDALNMSAVSLTYSAHEQLVAAVELENAAVRLQAVAAGGGAVVSAQGGASRTIEDATAGVPSPISVAAATGVPLSAGLGGSYGGVLLPGMMPGMQGSLRLSGAQTLRSGINATLANFGIGQPVRVITGAGSVTTVPWATATAAQKLSSIARSSGFATLLAGAGSMLAFGGLARGGLGGNIETVAGGALAGIGIAKLIPALQLTYLGGALLGGGIGIAAAGLQRGGKVGLGMSIGGGALAGAVIGTAVFPGLGTAAGAAIGAIVGGIAGLIRLFNPNLDERIRSEIKRVYGVDIAQKSIRDTIAEIVKSKYGGNLSIALYSQDVQDIVRLYALNVGQSQAGLPRPMYAATFAQSQVGGLQMQPVYSGGQLVQNPYTGTTSTQLQNAMTTTSPLFIQLNPQQALNLFTGQVVKVLGDNPGAVAGANTTAAQTGTSRTSQVSALMEPLAVTR